MTKEKYTELTENLIDRYCQEWPDYDITLPSFEEAQEQERDGILLLENKEEKETVKTKNFEKRNEKVLESWEKKGKGEKTMKNIDLERAFDEAFNKNYKKPEIEQAGFESVYSRDSRTGKWAQTPHSKLDEREFYRTLERQKKGKAQSVPLTEGQKELFDSLSGTKKKEIDHSLDEAFAEAFGSSSRKVEILNDIQEAALGNLLLEDLNVDNIIIEEAPGGAFKFRGKALKVGRRNKNNRRYRKEIVEKALGEAQSQVLTIRDGHPKKNDTAVSPVIGKVVFGELNAEGWMPYTATLSNTSRSRDIQELLRDKVIGSVSLRSRGRTAVAKMDGESIEDVIELNFRGLDLVSEGSEQGAGVDEILSAVA